MARFLRDLQHMALKRFPLLAWKTWHLKNWLRPDNEFEADFVNRFDSFIDSPTRTAIDIGANFGIYTRLLVKRFDETHAVEPLPNLARPLAQAGLRNCFVHEVALGAEYGEIELSIPYTATKGAVFALTTADADRIDMSGDDISKVEKVRVRVVPFDDEFKRLGDIDFIKIDVEGSELNALRGGHDTLSRQKPVVMIEAEKQVSKHESTAIFDFFEQLGYTPFYFREGKLIQTDRSILDVMADYHASQPSREGYRRYRDENYVYNYIFSPLDKVKRP